MLTCSHAQLINFGGLLLFNAQHYPSRLHKRRAAIAAADNNNESLGNWIDLIYELVSMTSCSSASRRLYVQIHCENSKYRDDARSNRKCKRKSDNAEDRSNKTFLFFSSFKNEEKSMEIIIDLAMTPATGKSPANCLHFYVQSKYTLRSRYLSDRT